MISQIIIILIGFSISFLISKANLSIWRNILGFFLGFLVAWIGGGIFVVCLFDNSNFTEALVSELSIGIWFALVSAGAGVYYGRKRTPEVTIKNASAEGTNQYGKNPKGNDNNREIGFNKPIINSPSKGKAFKKGSNSSRVSDKHVQTEMKSKNKINGIPKVFSSQSKNEGSKMKKKNDITVNENELYEQVWREIEENKTDIGLWAKCFSTCEGDENKTKALYVNERVLILKENLKKQIIDQERKAEKEAEKEAAEKETAKKLLAVEGKTDDIRIFQKTIDTMPNFFPKILDQFGYKLVHSKDKEELWSIHSPSGTGVRHVYDLFDLRKEIRKIVINSSDSGGVVKNSGTKIKKGI